MIHTIIYMLYIKLKKVFKFIVIKYYYPFIKIVILYARKFLFLHLWNHEENIYSKEMKKEKREKYMIYIKLIFSWGVL